MSKPIENCPVEEKPIRERAWTAEQLLELADRVETCNRVSVQREAASALRFAATLRQPTNPPEIGSKLVDGAAELAGYVDPEQVADMQKNGGGVSIVSFSERYGRTHPVYYLRAPGGQGGRVDEELVLEGLDYFEKAGDDGDKRYVRAIRAYTNSLQAALAQNAQPKTLGDFVRLPDSERVAIGRQVVDRAIEMQNAQGKAVAYVGDDDDAQFAIPTGAGLKLPAGTPLYLHAEPKNAQGEAVEPMSLAVALHFADYPRPFDSLSAPADTNGELYRALKVLASAYRATTGPGTPEQVLAYFRAPNQTKIFEAWMARSGADLTTRDGDVYASRETMCCWNAWLVSSQRAWKWCEEHLHAERARVPDTLRAWAAESGEHYIYEKARTDVRAMLAATSQTDAGGNT